MDALKRHLRTTVTPLAETFRNPGLRRLQLAWVGSLFGTWFYIVALSVYAYEHGGAGAVGLVGVIRMVPAGLMSPIASTLADRFPRRWVMVWADLIRAALMGAAAVVIGTGGPAWAVYAIATASSVTASSFGPAQSALIPTLARTPAELTAANVASSTLDSVAMLAGPAIGGIVFAATNAETVFALNGASFVWSALLVLGIRVTEPVSERRRQGAAHGHGMTGGFRVILGNKHLTRLVGLYTGQTFVAGALSVFVVVTALQLLQRGSTTVGLLNAALGLGGLVGGFVALALAGRDRLATDFAIGLALFGAPLAAIAGVADLAVALIALGVVGIGNSLVDVAGVTLLQRSVPDETLGRAMGVLHGLILGSIGVGAAVAPLLIHAFGVRTALVITAAVLPVLAVLSVPGLAGLDAPAPAGVALLRTLEIFAPLPPPTLERLAASLVDVRFPAGAVVIQKGDPGDRFYVVGEGEVEIEGNVFGPGSSFGEIALLRDVPRTATVTARTDVLLHALERDEFLAAVTQHESSSAAADAVIAHRLGELRADLTAEGGAA